MRKCLMILCFTCMVITISTTIGYAQRSYVDSLKSELSRKDIADSTRTELYLLLGYEISFRNIDSGNIFLRRALTSAIAHNDPGRIGRACNFMANNFSRQGSFDSSKAYYKRAIYFYKKDTSALAKINICINRMCIGGVLQTQGYHIAAIKYYTEGIDSLEKLDFDTKYNILASAYTNIGNIYNDLGQYGKMLQYDKQALAIAKNHSISPVKTVQMELLIAMALTKMKNFKEAAVYLAMGDSLAKVVNTDYVFAMQYGILGRYYCALGNIDNAESAYKKSYDYSVKAKNLFQQNSMLSELGLMNYDLKDYTKSLEYFTKSYELSKKTGDKLKELTALKYLSKTYAAVNNNRSSVRYYQLYDVLKDSMDKVDNKRTVQELEEKYQAQKKEDSIVILTKNTQLKDVELYRRKGMATALLAGCTLLLLLAIAIYLNFKRKNQLLKQAEQLQTQKIGELQKQQQLLTLESVLKGQEAERRRLAKDLHDGVGGLLSGVKLSLSTMQGNVFLSEKHAGRLNTVIAQLDESIHELRRVSHNMMPESLIKFGLRETLINYCDAINDAGQVTVQLQTFGLEERMDQNTEIVLFRIIQELLNNVIKHSGASHVLVQLVRKKDWFNLTVEDDGKGFDMDKVSKKEGAGLSNIRARAEYLGVNIDIHSKPGEGTSVNIEGTCT